jgi:hypothetical protein
MKDLLKNIVGAVAPTLGTALGGPLGDIFKLETEDVQDARSKFSGDWTSKFLGFITIGGFMGYIFLVTLQPPEQNSEALINLVLGYLGGLASAVISFYFGASNTPKE